MGSQERKEREKEEARNRIIEIAGRLFVELGAEKTSIRKIAQEAEYSPAYLYTIFKDKNELLYHVHERAMQNFNELLESAPVLKDPIADFRQQVELYIQFARNEPYQYDLMFVLKSPLKDMDMEWMQGNRAFVNLQRKVEGLMEKGLIEQGDSRERSLLIWSTLHGIVTLELSGRFSIFRDRTESESANAGIEEFLRILFHKKAR